MHVPTIYSIYNMFIKKHLTCTMQLWLLAMLVDILLYTTSSRIHIEHIKPARVPAHLEAFARAQWSAVRSTRSIIFHSRFYCLLLSFVTSLTGLLGDYHWANKIVGPRGSEMLVDSVGDQ